MHFAHALAQEKQHSKSLAHILPNLACKKKSGEESAAKSVSLVSDEAATHAAQAAAEGHVDDSAFKAELDAAEKEVQCEKNDPEARDKPRKRQPVVQKKIDAAPRSLEELCDRVELKARIDRIAQLMVSCHIFRLV